MFLLCGGTLFAALFLKPDGFFFLLCVGNNRANKMMEYWSRFTHVPLCSGGVDMSQKTILHCLCMRAEAAGPVQYLLEVGNACCNACSKLIFVMTLSALLPIAAGLVRWFLPLIAGQGRPKRS